MCRLPETPPSSPFPHCPCSQPGLEGQTWARRPSALVEPAPTSCPLPPPKSTVSHAPPAETSPGLNKPNGTFSYTLRNTSTLAPLLHPTIPQPLAPRANGRSKHLPNSTAHAQSTRTTWKHTLTPHAPLSNSVLHITKIIPLFHNHHTAAPPSPPPPRAIPW